MLLIVVQFFFSCYRDSLVIMFYNYLCDENMKSFTIPPLSKNECMMLCTRSKKSYHACCNRHKTAYKRNPVFWSVIILDTHRRTFHRCFCHWTNHSCPRYSCRLSPSRPLQYHIKLYIICR